MNFFSFCYVVEHFVYREIWSWDYNSKGEVRGLYCIFNTFLLVKPKKRITLAMFFVHNQIKYLPVRRHPNFTNNYYTIQTISTLLSILIVWFWAQILPQKLTKLRVQTNSEQIVNKLSQKIIKWSALPCWTI